MDSSRSQRMDEKTNDGAGAPRDEWTQVRETVRMLFLAVAQIEIALGESDDSIEHLTSAFTRMMAHEQAIAEAVERLPDSPETRNLRDEIRERAQLVSGDMQGAIVAFQFYDKLTQRLGHVVSSLEAMSELVSDPQRLHDPRQWQQLQQQIRSRYSMREERELFDHIMQDGDIREALRRYNEAHGQDLQDDIEFF